MLGRALFVGLLAAPVAVAPVLVQEPADIAYDVQTLLVHGRRVDTAAYDFNGDGRLDIINTSIDAEIDPPARWAAIHYQRENRTFPAKPDRVIQIDDRAAALAFGDMDGDAAVEVLFLASDGVYFYPSPGEAFQRVPRKLLHIATFFTRPALSQISVWQWGEDFDGNGLHDLMVPTDEGTRIYFQTERGRFGRIRLLEAEVANPARRALRVTGFAEVETARATTFAFEKRIPRIDAVDLNGDGRRDLAVINGDRLTVFLQDAGGGFDSRETRVVKTLSRAETAGAIEVSGVWFQDLDHDGFPELIVSKIEGKLGMVDSLQTNLYIHKGNGTAAFTPDHTVLIPGLSLYPAFIDINRDSRDDLVATYVTTGFLKKALETKLFGDMEVTTDFWRLSDGRYQKPDDTYRLLVKVSDTDNAPMPVFFVGGDLSGDGRPDLLVVTPDPPELRVHFARRAERAGISYISIEPRPRTIVPLKEFPRWVVFQDMNGDGLLDLQLHRPDGLDLCLSRKK